jgi:hypothetical protein
MHRLIRSTLGLLFVAVPLAAQTVHPGIGVRVRAPSVLLDRLEVVYLGRGGGDTLLFGNQERGPIRVSGSAITELQISAGRSRMRGALRGALIVGAIMAGLGAGMASSGDSTVYNPRVDGSRGSFIAMNAFAGAMTGGIAGLFIPVHIWRGADPRMLLNAALRPDAPSLGVRFALAYSR